MDPYLAASSARRRNLCEQAAERLGLQAASIEKDYWVCRVLQALFGLDEIGPQITFKGGTSLSKVWKLIQRFSEDIDLVIDRRQHGFAGTSAPEQAGISGKERERRLATLGGWCRKHVEERVRPALAESLRTQLGERGWSLESDPGDEEGQTLLFHYPSSFASGGYVSAVVRIELGARSDVTPSSIEAIEPYLHEALPELRSTEVIRVRALAPERTFWEKAMLLHEETYRVGGKGLKARLARHYYDLWRLIEAGVARRASADLGLFGAVVAHRKTFFRRPEAQKSIEPGSLRLLPRDDHRAAWKRDYEAMREAMIFGEAPSFEEILARVGEFEREFNATRTGDE